LRHAVHIVVALNGAILRLFAKLLFCRGESFNLKIRPVWIVLTIALAVTVFGCSKKSSEQPAQPPPPTALVNPATAGTITGTVRLEGRPPAFQPIDMSAEPTCVKANPKPVTPAIFVTGPHDALANVVVYVKSGLGRFRFEVPQTPVVLNQKGCMYQPRVLATRVGQPLEVRNEDPTVHNIHVMARVNRSWNRSEEPGEQPFKATFQHPELAIPISCNVHPWMRAFLFVFDNPYFAITTETGRFELRGLPPGAYTIEAWQEYYGAQDESVTLASKETKSISFVFKAEPPK
jgi:plastocyanin